jgi:hypothetical protein
MAGPMTPTSPPEDVEPREIDKLLSTFQSPEGQGAISGSSPTGQAPAGLDGSRCDPGRGA